MAFLRILLHYIFILRITATVITTTTEAFDDISTVETTTLNDEYTTHHEEQSLIKRKMTVVPSPKEVTRYKFSDLIPADYSIHEPPPLINDKPVPVRFSVSLKNIPDINELKQTLSVEMNLRIYWRDTRLTNAADLLFQRSNTNHSYLSLHPVVLSEIWVPDIYTDYAKSVSNQRILSPPISLRIYPNATIRYSARIMMELSCPMDFRMYPADSQKCDLRLESYGFTREELSFSWIPEGRPVNIGHRLAHFDFSVTLINDKEDVNFPSGSYPAISICLRLQRRLNYHLLQTYIPSGLFVVVSWLSFLVPRECAPGRLAICMTTLLTLTAMFAAVRQNTPSVSYIKALDVWMVGCIVFVFFALAEFATVLRLDKKSKVRERKNKKSPTSHTNATSNGRVNWSCSSQNETTGKFRSLPESPDEEGKGLRKNKWSPNSKEDSASCGIEIERTVRCWPWKKSFKMNNETITKLRRDTEVMSSWIAPIGFILFNLCYWPWLLHASEGTCY